MGLATCASGSCSAAGYALVSSPPALCSSAACTQDEHCKRPAMCATGECCAAGYALPSSQPAYCPSVTCTQRENLRGARYTRVRRVHRYERIRWLQCHGLRVAFLSVSVLFVTDVHAW